MYQQTSFFEAFKRGFMRMPAVIRTIIALNVIVFILLAFGGRGFQQWMVNWFGLSPDMGTLLTQPWRLVTYMFIHVGGFHLIFNMLWLWWMGRSVEQTIGPRTFAVIYFGSGIGGAMLHIALSFIYGSSVVIGASGAVFGIMVAFATIFPTMPIMLIFLPPIEARFVVAGLIFLDILFIGSGDNVARLVHLGGAGVGYLLVKSHNKGVDLASYVRPLESLWKKSPRKRKPNEKMYSVSDVEIMEEADADELDEILDKISKKGYDGLTKEEKKKLFDLSKRN